ncbi:glucan 1,3-alpha-glucosidase [Sulfodiicoccus acidiphilus]|uniref:Glucan 1,3-alpha-glucosidase n=1 Tax=Sulfodiicoccus acidiphilus TaxID=1670455 RepID=A0A348B2E6_9CREN|nr:glycoside hydrolase family 15 protein [Sulfodiicoccus acidiphilus]BBD72348.1 glucan 1,3-alpha-glucosidase [Sulfodiicoccus acidiphilus]GGT90113.1 glucan 1,3-alpha-glucosidase [Sulfodiicoccus acidiphilus]
MRCVILGNGKYTVLYDQSYALRDVYYPYKGMHNHSLGGKSKVGIWHDGKFTWFEDIPKKITMNGLVSTAYAEWDGLKITFHDTVDFYYNALIRKIRAEGPGFVRFIFYHDLRLRGNAVGDTAFYDPFEDVLIHYKESTYFLAGSSRKLYEYTTGRRDQGAVLKDSEDGSLSKNPIAQGSVDSAISIAYPEFYYWLVVGDSRKDVERIHAELSKDPDHYFKRNLGYWRSLLSKHEGSSLVKSSLAVLMAHLGEKGEVPASLDTGIMKFNLDTYAYIWPRDATLAMMVLDQLGYHSATKKFYQFLFSLFGEKGYLFQKYNPDGTQGSTWHPWTIVSDTARNIQEDETATAIFGFWRYFQQSRDYDLLKSVYDKVRQAMDFMTWFRDSKLKLPLASYDLWEERLGTHTYTAATVYAGMSSAAKLAGMLGNDNEKEGWEQAAEEVRQGILNYMFDRERGVFYRTVRLSGDGKILEVDKTIDSSLLATLIFDVFRADDPVIESTVKVVERTLWVTKSGGLARYENDYYQRVEGSYNGIQGNPWIITTMWLAQYHAARGDVDRASELLSWAESVATPTGLLPEQVSPFDKTPLSVTPLLWSHAEYLRAFLMTNS